MLEAGIKGQHTIIVEKENTAAVMKSGTLAVFATPAMIALIEETAWKSVADELEESVEDIQPIYDIVKKHAPEYDVDAITTEVLEARENEKV